MIVGDRRPEHKELAQFLVEHSLKWKDIGLQLGLQQSLINLIEADHPLNKRECFRVALQRWLEQDVHATWSTLELAITNANRISLGCSPLDKSKNYLLHR